MPFTFDDPGGTLRAAEERVAKQRRLVERLLQRDLPTTQAVAFLETLERVLGTMRSVEFHRPAVVLNAFSQNRLLHSLTLQDLECISTHAQLVEFQRGQILLEAGQPIYRVAFIESGIVTAVAGGARRGIEVATIGREGVVGAEVVQGLQNSPLSYVALFGGQAIQIEAVRLNRSALTPAFLDALLRFNEILRIQSASAAIAGSAFPLGQRVARSLLMYQDRADSEELEVTHSTLAETLAVRRAGVTEALHRLEGDLLIRAQRSSILVRNRYGLEERAGESYGMAEKMYGALFQPIVLRSGRQGLEPSRPGFVDSLAT